MSAAAMANVYTAVLDGADESGSFFYLKGADIRNGQFVHVVMPGALEGKT
jgi:hypothetical protein